MPRRLLAASVAVALVACAPGDVPPAAPNLLLVTIDTLRADRVTCRVGREDPGAALCDLVRGGARFTWAVAPAPYTAPSIASILTSRYPAGHRVTQSALSFLAEDATSVAEALAAGGYSTAAFVSNPVLDRTRGLAQGFDIWDQHMTRSERNRPGFREREAEATTEAVLKWARIGATAPWFIWVHYQDPHGPYEPPAADPVAEDPRGPLLPLLADHSGRGGIPAYQALPGARTPGPYAKRYDAEVRYVSREVARLVAGLDALGERPAILITADHGEALGEDDYWFAHGHSLGLDQIRVPLLWRPPGAVRGGPARQVSAAVGLVDIAPTLAAVAGVPIPESFEGMPLPVDGIVSPDRRPIFSEHERRVAVILGDRYYARDRADFTRSAPDPTSGGVLDPLPARTARLTPDGANPDYTPAPTQPDFPLEVVITDFTASPRGPAATRRDALTPETRKRLEALGYLD